MSLSREFSSTKFGTNDVYFFTTTADQTLVIEAHVGLDDKWRGGGEEGRGGGRGAGTGGKQQFSIFQL